MKKRLKLLLLGGIFTLIGIFNFSSAYVYETVRQGVVDIGGGSITTVPINPNNPYQNHSFNTSAVSLCLDLDYSNYNWVRLNSYPDKIMFNSDLCIDNSSFGSWFYGFDIYGRSSVSSSFKLYYVLPDPPVIEGTFDNFTPVITGVKDTTFQLIPLVVYIGIGLLIVTLGFYAIRWLVNWILGKINSNFSSKRG